MKKNNERERQRVSDRAFQHFGLSFYQKYSIDLDRTRTCNPQIRSLVPYPLGHKVSWWKLLGTWSQNPFNVATQCDSLCKNTTKHNGVIENIGENLPVRLYVCLYVMLYVICMFIYTFVCHFVGKLHTFKFLTNLCCQLSALPYCRYIAVQKIS